MPSLNLANRLTLCRITVVPFFVSAVLYYTPEKDYLRFVALGIFVFAVLLDLLDGYIARRYGEITRAGSILDPLADKVLLMSAFVGLHWIRGVLPSVHFPIWFVVFVVSRDMVLMLGALVIQMIKGDLHPRPSIWGKASTVCQVLSILAVLLQWTGASVIWTVTTGVSAFAALQYIRDGLLNLSEGGQA